MAATTSTSRSGGPAPLFFKAKSREHSFCAASSLARSISRISSLTGCGSGTPTTGAGTGAASRGRLLGRGSAPPCSPPPRSGLCLLDSGGQRLSCLAYDHGPLLEPSPRHFRRLPVASRHRSAGNAGGNRASRAGRAHLRYAENLARRIGGLVRSKDAEGLANRLGVRTASRTANARSHTKPVSTRHNACRARSIARAPILAVATMLAYCSSTFSARSYAASRVAILHVRAPSAASAFAKLLISGTSISRRCTSVSRQVTSASRCRTPLTSLAAERLPGIFGERSLNGHDKKFVLGNLA